MNRYHVEEAGIYNECPFYPECNQEMVTSPYRTITGVCNNVHPPGSVPWGVPNTRYQRALAPEYADGDTSRFLVLKNYSVEFKTPFVMGRCVGTSPG